MEDRTIGKGKKRAEKADGKQLKNRRNKEDVTRKMQRGRQNEGDGTRKIITTTTTVTTTATITATTTRAFSRGKATFYSFSFFTLGGVVRGSFVECCWEEVSAKRTQCW